MTANRAINPTVQSRRFACCWPAGYRERYAASKSIRDCADLSFGYDDTVNHKLFSPH